MHRQGFSRLAAVLIVGACAAVGLVFYTFGHKARDHGSDRAICQSNLKQIGLGLMQYVQDYDGRYPPRTGGTKVYGWVNALYPYTKSRQLFYCPQVEAERSDDPRQLGYSDYWMNANLFSVQDKKLHSPTATILAGDGNDGQDATTARYSASVLPAAWLGNHASPAYRHHDTMNLLFADGHVKAMAPDQIVENPKSGYASFEIK